MRDHGPVKESTLTANRSVSGLETEEGRLALNVGSILRIESSPAAPPGFLTVGIWDQLPHFFPHALLAVIDCTPKLGAKINFFSIAFANYFIRRDLLMKMRVRAVRWERSARAQHGPS